MWALFSSCILMLPPGIMPPCWYYAVSCLKQEESPNMFGVRLDLFNALNRISRKIRKKHGAFKPFMARLRDACFLINRNDIREASY